MTVSSQHCWKRMGLSQVVYSAHSPLTKWVTQGKSCSLLAANTCVRRCHTKNSYYHDQFRPTFPTLSMPFIGGFQITCVTTKAREPIVEQESAGLDREEYLYAEDLHTQDAKSFAASNDNKEVKVEDLTLLELRRKLQDFARARNWDQFHSPRNLLLALVGEVGELSEIFQWKGEVQRGCPDWNPSEKEHLEEELSDVLLYLVRLADVCGVHLGQAALIKLQKNAIKYPTETRKASPSNHQSQMTSINRKSREPHQYLTGSTPNM